MCFHLLPVNHKVVSIEHVRDLPEDDPVFEGMFVPPSLDNEHLLQQPQHVVVRPQTLFSAWWGGCGNERVVVSGRAWWVVVRDVVVRGVGGAWWWRGRVRGCDGVMWGV